MGLICHSHPNLLGTGCFCGLSGSLSSLPLNANSICASSFYFPFSAALQREDVLAVRLEKRIKGIRKVGHTPHSSGREGKYSEPLSELPAPLNRAAMQIFAVSMSTVAVLTEGAVVQQPSALPHHLFKSPKQKKIEKKKPGERST